jgi:hypothetical protein
MKCLGGRITPEWVAGFSGIRNQKLIIEVIPPVYPDFMPILCQESISFRHFALLPVL